MWCLCFSVSLYFPIPTLGKEQNCNWVKACGKTAQKGLCKTSQGINTYHETIKITIVVSSVILMLVIQTSPIQLRPPTCCPREGIEIENKKRLSKLYHWQKRSKKGQEKASTCAAITRATDFLLDSCNSPAISTSSRI